MVSSPDLINKRKWCDCLLYKLYYYMNININITASVLENGEWRMENWRAKAGRDSRTWSRDTKFSGANRDREDSFSPFIFPWSVGHKKDFATITA